MLMRMVTYHVRVAYPFWFFHSPVWSFLSNSHHCRCQAACYVIADGQAMAHCHFQKKENWCCPALLCHQPRKEVHNKAGNISVVTCCETWEKESINTRIWGSYPAPASLSLPPPLLSSLFLSPPLPSMSPPPLYVSPLCLPTLATRCKCGSSE